MKKTLFALGTFLPIAFGVALLVVGFSDTAAERFLESAYLPVLGVTIVTWIAYLIDVLRNQSLGKDKKGLWIALLVFGTIFAEAAYLFVHILRTPRASESRA